MRLLHEKKNRMCAMLICHFVFPSYATTSPMRIATIHSVHLPLFLDFMGIYFIPTGHSNCFYTKNQFLFCYLPDFSPVFFSFFPFLYIAVIFLWANRKRETAKAVSKESTRYKLQQLAQWSDYNPQHSIEKFFLPVQHFRFILCPFCLLSV